MEVDCEAFLAAGADKVILKPLREPVLVDILSSLSQTSKT
jgi:hypothetical protein